MSTAFPVLRRGRKGGEGGKGAGGSLTWRADQLAEAIEIGGAQLDPAAVASAQEVVQRVRERWALKGGRTVVSLAGATGSGKSTLFNALVGETVSTSGARRPTTSTATAAVWGEEDAGPLLDWLAVPHRHEVSAPPSAGSSGAGSSGSRPGGSTDAADLDGLVLIDLPDFDSRETAHRVEADRLLARSDVFVWVTDPQKYADARLHEDYLATLQDHETVMIVVLNQIDRIDDSAAVYKIKQDLSRLIAADGAGDFEVIGTSARTTRGLDVLREAIGGVVSERNAAEHRLRGDLSAAARMLAEGVGPDEPASGDVAGEELHRALSQAAGIPVVLRAVQQDYRRRSTARTGWPFTRWLAAARPDPLRRLRLGDDRAGLS
ncbi:MAG: 50S ribosome-binding GTPase, partial [Actinobacteria bacterium]|nr:50S ribosome-binding GTPase [Actinomycetota bacterium]